MLKQIFQFLASVAVMGLMFMGISEETVQDYQSPNDTVIYDAFSHWKKEYKKSYGAEEDDQKFQVFKQNFNYIHAHNISHDDLKLSLNQFADLTHNEFKSIHLGYKHQDQESKVAYLEEKTVPESLDWRDKNAVTPIKNQGQCGSCWAFSAIGALEGQYAIKNGKLISFSEQQLVDCSKDQGNMGCNGGLMDNAFRYVEQFGQQFILGIESEQDYPYKAISSLCEYQKEKEIFKVDDFVDVPKDSPTQLILALQKGPVSVAIDAGEPSFQFYKEGVYNQPCGNNLNHGVLIVGYTRDYYIVKNSWGETWGDQGYIKMKKDDNPGDGICGIRMSASYPILKTQVDM